jgi:hypothetical protein
LITPLKSERIKIRLRDGLESSKAREPDAVPLELDDEGLGPSAGPDGRDELGCNRCCVTSVVRSIVSPTAASPAELRADSGSTELLTSPSSTGSGSQELRALAEGAATA